VGTPTPGWDGKLTFGGNASIARINEFLFSPGVSVEVDRRALLQGISVAPTLTMATAAGAAPFSDDMVRDAAEHLDIADEVALAAFRRLSGPLRRASALAIGRSNTDVVNICAQPGYLRRWRTASLDLTEAVGVLSPGAEAEIATGAPSFRMIGACAFGGITVGLFRRYRSAAGLIVKGRPDLEGARLQFTQARWA